MAVHFRLRRMYRLLLFPHELSLSAVVHQESVMRMQGTCPSFAPSPILFVAMCALTGDIYKSYAVGCIPPRPHHRWMGWGSPTHLWERFKGFRFAILPAPEENIPVDGLSSLAMDSIGFVGIAGTFR